ncbi:MAG: hypothetical protein KGI08_04990 [Thaumarchaeota archaeon]|nr:hypothetical protein [Nitrososphaerota archaeon]
MQKLILESTLVIESHKISGIALIPRISRNQNLYLPEELKRADGKTVPLNWEHQTEKSAIGQVTFHYDKDLQQLRYEGIITDENAYTLIKNRTHHVSIGAEPSSVKSVCGSEQCYNLPEGLNFKELSIVATPGIPESTVNLIESFSDSKLVHENCTKCRCDCTESGLSPHAADRPDSDFAYVPKDGTASDRKFPIYDAAHVRNALARYSQAEIPSGEKSKVMSRICSAAKKFGVDSDICKPKEGIQDRDHEFVGSGATCQLCGEDRNHYKHGKQAVYDDTQYKSVSNDHVIGYKDDPDKKPIMPTEKIVMVDDEYREIVKNLKEKVYNLEYIVTKETHKFIPHDTYKEKCSICGQKSSSAIHADAKIHQECTKCKNQTCSICGGIKKTNQ